MQQILDLIKSLNISPEQMQEIAALAQQNPFAAMGRVSQLGISMESLQKIMAAGLANPSGFMQLAKEFGADEGTLKTVENGLNQFKNRD